MHGVGGDDPVGQAEGGEQVMNRRDPVRLPAHIDVAEDQAGRHVERADQMDGGAVGEVVEAATQGLAVEGNHPHPLATA